MINKLYLVYQHEYMKDSDDESCDVSAVFDTLDDAKNYIIDIINSIQNNDSDSDFDTVEYIVQEYTSSEMFIGYRYNAIVYKTDPIDYLKG